MLLEDRLPPKPNVPRGPAAAQEEARTDRGARGGGSFRLTLLARLLARSLSLAGLSCFSVLALLRPGFGSPSVNWGAWPCPALPFPALGASEHGHEGDVPHEGPTPTGTPRLRGPHVYGDPTPTGPWSHCWHLRLFVMAIS